MSNIRRTCKSRKSSCRLSRNAKTLRGDTFEDRDNLEIQMYEKHPLENRDRTRRGSCFLLSTICICLQESGTSVWLGASSHSQKRPHV